MVLVTVFNFDKKRDLRYFMAKKKYSILSHSLIVQVIICTCQGNEKMHAKF